jgi:hypothetical protein
MHTLASRMSARERELALRYYYKHHNCNEVSGAGEHTSKPAAHRMHTLALRMSPRERELAPRYYYKHHNPCNEVSGAGEQ